MFPLLKTLNGPYHLIFRNYQIGEDGSQIPIVPESLSSIAAMHSTMENAQARQTGETSFPSAGWQPSAEAVLDYERRKREEEEYWVKRVQEEFTVDGADDTDVGHTDTGARSSGLSEREREDRELERPMPPEAENTQWDPISDMVEVKRKFFNKQLLEQFDFFGDLDAQQEAVLAHCSSHGDMDDGDETEDDDDDDDDYAWSSAGEEDAEYQRSKAQLSTTIDSPSIPLQPPKQFGAASRVSELASSSNGDAQWWLPKDSADHDADDRPNDSEINGRVERKASTSKTDLAAPKQLMHKLRSVMPESILDRIDKGKRSVDRQAVHASWGRLDQMHTAPAATTPAATADLHDVECDVPVQPLQTADASSAEAEHESDDVAVLQPNASKVHSESWNTFLGAHPSPTSLSNSVDSPAHSFGVEMPYRTYRSQLLNSSTHHVDTESERPSTQVSDTLAAPDWHSALTLGATSSSAMSDQESMCSDKPSDYSCIKDSSVASPSQPPSGVDVRWHETEEKLLALDTAVYSRMWRQTNRSNDSAVPSSVRENGSSNLSVDVARPAALRQLSPSEGLMEIEAVPSQDIVAASPETGFDPQRMQAELQRRLERVVLGSTAAVNADCLLHAQTEDKSSEDKPAGPVVAVPAESKLIDVCSIEPNIAARDDDAAVPSMAEVTRPPGRSRSGSTTDPKKKKTKKSSLKSKGGKAKIIALLEAPSSEPAISVADLPNSMSSPASATTTMVQLEADEMSAVSTRWGMGAASQLLKQTNISSNTWASLSALGQYASEVATEYYTVPVTSELESNGTAELQENATTADEPAVIESAVDGTAETDEHNGAHSEANGSNSMMQEQPTAKEQTVGQDKSKGLVSALLQAKERKSSVVKAAVTKPTKVPKPTPAAHLQNGIAQNAMPQHAIPNPIAAATKMPMPGMPSRAPVKQQGVRREGGGNAKPVDLSNYYVRLSTFARWPRRDFAPEPLARAGFYYSGRDHSDLCACFCCRGTMYDWDPADDPWLEHKKMNPRCSFINRAPQPPPQKRVQPPPQQPTRPEQPASLAAATPLQTALAPRTSSTPNLRQSAVAAQTAMPAMPFRQAAPLSSVAVNQALAAAEPVDEAGPKSKDAQAKAGEEENASVAKDARAEAGEEANVRAEEEAKAKGGEEAKDSECGEIFRLTNVDGSGFAVGAPIHAPVAAAVPVVAGTDA